MDYFCDYEALERPRSIIKKGMIPPWLSDEKYNTLLIPLCFTACTSTGKIANSQDYNMTRYISFLDFLDSIIRWSKYKQTKIYFHNLFYDFNIILYELMYKGFTQYINDYKGVEYDNIEVLENKVTDFDKTFIVMGENLRTATGVNILYRGRVFMLRDTFRILSSSQDAILKAFGYPLKPDIDFDNLDINDYDQIVALRERNRYDVLSLAQCIIQFKKTLKEEYGAEGDTAASIALSAAKHFLGDEFEDLYPKIGGTPYDTLSRIAYNGGICQHSYHQVAGTVHEHLTYIDENSAYPHTMRMDIPYGLPKEIDYIEYEQYSEYLVKISFRLIKPNIPAIRCSSATKVLHEYGYQSDSYHKKDELPHEFNGYLCLSIWDIKMLDRWYDYEIEVIKGYLYQTKPILKDFIENLYRLRYLCKKAKNAVMVLAIKLILNSLYGKFAQDLTGWQEFITHDEKIKLFARDTNKIYCPLATYITSCARYNLMVVVNYEPLNFLYCDTDSCIVFDRAKLPVNITGGNLGQWGYEYDGAYVDKCKILGKKNYMLEINGEVELKCVGLPRNRDRIYDNELYEEGLLRHPQIYFDTFFIGAIFIIQKMRKVYGGQAMHYTQFSIQERMLYRG